MPKRLSDVVRPQEQLPYLNKEQVARWDEVYITHAIYQPNAQFGPQYRYKIRYNVPNVGGQDAYVTMGEGMEQRKELCDHFKSSVAAIGPVKLRKRHSAKGASYWLWVDSDEPDEEETPDLFSGDDPASVSDDDLPF